MTRRLFIFIFFIYPLISFGQNELGGIGQWREHFNNLAVIQLGNVNSASSEYKILGASNQQVFFLSEKNKIKLAGKSTGLHDVSISCTAWDEEVGQLIVAYNNSNIDIIKGDQVYSITDLLLSNLYSNKKINHIYLLHQWALLSTDFGIVVLDLLKHEIKDTWFPNNNRQVTKTYQVVCTSTNLYASTENGIWISPLKNNWITNSQWQNNIDYNNAAIYKLTQLNNIVFGASENMIYQLPSASPYYKIDNGQIKNIKLIKEGLYASVSNGISGKLIKINADKSANTIIDSTALSNPVDFLLDQSNIWVADSNNGLLLKNTTTQRIPLGGPGGNIHGQIFVNPENLIAPFGENSIGFSMYNQNGWKTITSINGKNLPFCYSSAIDPIEGSAWFASSQGLLRYHFDNGNIDIASPVAYKGFYRDVQFGKDGTLWTLLDQQGILQLQNNSWKLITPPNTISLIGVKKMIVNEQGQAWMIAPQHQGIIVYNPAAAGEKWSILNTYNNNLPSSTVTGIVEDKNGTMWVGTNNGIGLFDCNEINNCKAFLPQIKNNNGFAGLLFQKETVNCISIDGANRKWVGTNNGSWLLSSDGSEIIQRFTKNNSPLPNDTINQIIIEPNTGEVFFNTQNQMVSYRSTATAAASTMKNIQIFPNPVAPNYNGPIAMRGLTENALVKITTLSGKLIFQTRAFGGQAIWEGKTYEGNKVATGIYLIFARDDAGNEKAVGKIVITNGQ